MASAVQESTCEPSEELERRISRTLQLMHRWGYAPSLTTLSAQLLGGPVDVRELRATVGRMADLVVHDEFVCLTGHERLLDRSRERVALHARLSDEARDIARRYARDLVRACPLVLSIALSGSLASGGFGPHDDIDFDLIVRPGTRYTSYLVAHLIGLRYAWRYRDRTMDEVHHTPLLPKIACINVVWTEDQARPFTRRDENMALELLRCIPLFGIDTFEEALHLNAWLGDYFPQALDRVWPESASPNLGVVGRVLEAVGKNPRMLALVERWSRRVAWRLYRGVQRSRRSNPVAVQRMEFLRRAKYPYEVFQD